MGQTVEPPELIFKASSSEEEEEEDELFKVFHDRFSYTLLNMLCMTSKRSSDFCIRDEESLKSDTWKKILNVWS